MNALLNIAIGFVCASLGLALLAGAMPGLFGLSVSAPDDDIDWENAG